MCCWFAPTTRFSNSLQCWSLSMNYIRKNATSKLQNMHSALERHLIYDGTTKIMVTHQPCLWLDPVPRLVSTTLPSKSPQADIFLINSPFCKWPQQKIRYIPIIYPYIFLHVQLITYQVILQPGSIHLDFDPGIIWMIKSQGFSPDGLYAATWHPTGAAKR